MKERDFLHEISNHLATAQISIEVLCESGASDPNLNKEDLEFIQTALSALHKLGKAIEIRREKLIGENQ